MKRITPKQRVERTIQALCDELSWGLRCYYAWKSIDRTELRITRTLFDTFRFSCLDQTGLILSRMVVAKKEAPSSNSVNLQYLAKQAENKPSIFHYAMPGEIDTLVKEQARLLKLYGPLIENLRAQRNRNIAHLDRRHVNKPEWQENQRRLDLRQVERLLQDLTHIMATYYRLFYGGGFEFGNWETISLAEVRALIEYYEAYRAKA